MPSSLASTAEDACGGGGRPLDGRRLLLGNAVHGLSEAEWSDAEPFRFARGVLTGLALTLFAALCAFGFWVWIFRGPFS